LRTEALRREVMPFGSLPRVTVRRKKIYPIALSSIKRETREVRVAPVSATQILTPQVPTAFDAVDLFVQDVVDDYRGRGFWRSEKISEESHHASGNGTGVE
jgi:hypothetical protein